MVTLSKSIGGGLPMALLLMRPELDQWQPGEHTGTFRGNNLAFVASTQALSYWDNDDMGKVVEYKGQIIKEELDKMAADFPELEPEVRGVGMVWGLELATGMASEASQEAFSRGLVMETAGADDQVLKFLPSLLIEEEILREGLQVVRDSLEALVTKQRKMITGEDSQ